MCDRRQAGSWLYWRREGSDGADGIGEEQPKAGWLLARVGTSVSEPLAPEAHRLVAPHTITYRTSGDLSCTLINRERSYPALVQRESAARYTSRRAGKLVIHLLPTH